MAVASRRTVIVHGRFSMREHRLAAARDRRHGLQILSFEHMAVRLACGFIRPIDNESLRAAIDLRARAAENPRLDAIAKLEKAVLAQLPAGKLRPCDIVAAADERLTHAPSVLGSVTIQRLKPEAWPGGEDHTPQLRALDQLLQGTSAAKDIGEALLKDRSLAIWRKALVTGPAASIDATLEALREDDGLEACVSVAWMPASALAASPRRFVRLIGLNSGRWPRNIAEDRLIPHHIIPTSALGVRRAKAALSSGCKPHPANSLQPEAIGAVMEVTKWLKPSISVSRIGDSAQEPGPHGSCRRRLVQGLRYSRGARRIRSEPVRAPASC